MVVEVGSGSGVISVFCQQLLRKPVFALATDVNFNALQVGDGVFRNLDLLDFA